MAFEEIKAKLGLDITAFEQGAVKAQRSIQTIAGEATKKFTDMKQVGQAAATALGISYQAIADGIARLVIGFSKEQEQALNDLVNATDKAASAQEAARDAAIKNNKRMSETLADREERIRYEKLTDEQKLDELYKKRDQLTKRALSTKDGSTINLKARLDILDVEEEIEKVKDRQFQKTKDEYEQTLKTEQILEEGVAEVVSMLVDKQAELEDQDKARTEELKKQRAELEAQARLKAEEIRAARIQDVKPTMEEVTSGKRNIGYNARQNARRLQAEQAKSQRLADEVQRNAEALDVAKSPADRRDAQRAFDASRAALQVSQERIKRGQEMLGTRISDANPYATMEAELKSIKTELTTLNKTTLAPTSTK